jgi:hypothetical protein
MAATTAVVRRYHRPRVVWVIWASGMRFAQIRG